MENDKKYALYTVVTENYILLAKLMIYSFLKNNTWFDGDINIICYRGYEKELVSREELAVLYDKMNFIDVDLKRYAKLFANAPENSFSKIPYLKLEIFNGGDYDRRVFLDSDVIVNGDIRELFEGPLANMDGLIACRDFHTVVNSHLDTESDVCYFNTGVMSVPKSMCDGVFYLKVLSFSAGFQEPMFLNRFSYKGQFIEQDVLNEFVKPDFVPKEVYNCPADFLERKDFDKVKIFHYYGEHKPYIPSEYRPAFDAFYKYFFLFANKW